MHIATQEQAEQRTKRALTHHQLKRQPDDCITRYVINAKGRMIPLYVRAVFLDVIIDYVPEAKSGLYYHYRQKHATETTGKQVLTRYYTTLKELDIDLLRTYGLTIYN